MNGKNTLSEILKRSMVIMLAFCFCRFTQAESLPIQISKAAVPVKIFDFEREQDLDFDRHPDNWTKRKGPGFHDYVTTEIVYDTAHQGRSSLCCTVDGSPMAIYSAPFRVDAEHSYVFEGYVKTKGLKYDAAVITVSYLDERRHRIMRFVSDAITGTKDWVHIQLPIMDPPDSVYQAVIGCHLIHSDRGDVSGKVWFDSFSVGRLPRLNLQSNFASSFKQARADVEVIAIASGLDTKYRYELEITIQDVREKTLASQKFFLKSSSVHPISFKNMAITAEANEPVVWKRPPFPTGFYYVYASLFRDGDEILKRKTTFAVMELIDEVTSKGQFGWSIHQNELEIASQDFLDIASQSGIHFLKLPLWNSAFSPNAGQKGRLLANLSERHIEPIGVLDKPPVDQKLYDKNNWAGVLDIFSLPPKYWVDKIHAVLALYSSPIRRWQLGSDEDTSFLGHPQLNSKLGMIRKEFDRIGRETVLGVQWNPEIPVPNTTEYGRSFMTFSSDMNSDLNKLVNSLESAKRIGFDAFVSLKMENDSEGQSKEDYHQRSIKLIKRLVDLRRLNVNKIVFQDVINEHKGLLRENGSPTELYLPWRTTALALADSDYVGSITMPQGSTNHIFTKDGKAIFVLWNELNVTEKIYLGDRVSMLNYWGERSTPAHDNVTGQQMIPVGPAPVFLQDCSLELVRWRQSTELAIGKVASSANEHEDSLRFYNSFKRMISGKVALHASDWTLTVPNPNFQLGPEEHMDIPFYVQLPSIARLGDQQFAIEFDVSTAEISHPFRVYLDYQVGVGDLSMQILLTETPEGHWLLEQRIENRTDPPETMNFRCEVFVRGRRRQVRSIDGLFSGQEIKRNFLITDPSELREQEIWIRAQQTNGRRVLNEVIDSSKIDDLIEQSRLLKLEEALSE